MDKIRCPVREHAIKISDQIALISGKELVSYDELDSLISLGKVLLGSEGIISGQRVAILGINSIEYIVTFFALIRMGAIACCISSRWPVSSIPGILKSIKCDALIITDPKSKTLQTSSYRVIFFDKVRRLNIARRQSQFKGIDKNVPVLIAEDQNATITFTSGTTTQPKAVLHEFGNHYYSALGANKNLPVDTGDRWLLSLSLYHVGGLAILFRCFLSGSTVVLKPKRASITTALKNYNISHISLVPTQLIRFINEDKSKEVLQNLRVILLGGDRIPENLMQKSLKHGFPIFSTYGLTEMASQVTTTGPMDSWNGRLTAGRLLNYRQLKISGEGEIMVKGRTLFKKYVNSGEKIHTRSKEAWFPTGDLGFLDKEGYLTVIGRKDNMFISGGENIYPEEIENVLYSFEKVSQVIIVPVSNFEFGYRPVAFIKTSRNLQFNIQELVDHCKKFLPQFKIPIDFYKWPQTFIQRKLKIDRSYFQRLAREQAGR